MPRSLAHAKGASAGEHPPGDLPAVTKLVEEGLSHHDGSLPSGLRELHLDGPVDSLAQCSFDMNSPAFEVHILPTEGAGLPTPGSDRCRHVHEESPELVFLFGRSDDEFDLCGSGDPAFGPLGLRGRASVQGLRETSPWSNASWKAWRRIA